MPGPGAVAQWVIKWVCCLLLLTLGVVTVALVVATTLPVSLTVALLLGYNTH